MKKSLIVLAVAGAFAAPAFADTANVDFYGQMRISLDHLNGGMGWGMNDETSRVGFKGAEDLGGGLKAIYQWESGLNIGTNSLSPTSSGALGTVNGTAAGAGGLGAERNTFVGLSGGFGTVLAGRHDTPYKMAGSADVFADTLADAQNGGVLCIICEDLRVNNAIAYVSPNMSGLSIVGAIVPGKFTDSTPTTKSLNSISDAYSLAGMYANGPFTVSAGYENLDHYVSNAASGSKQSAWKLNGGYTIGDLKLGATYEGQDKIGGVDGHKSSNYLLSAAYGMGPITLAGQYGYRNRNGDSNTAGLADVEDVTVGVVYSLSKRTNTYLGFASYKAKNATGAGANDLGAGDGSRLNVWTMGMNHSF